MDPVSAVGIALSIAPLIISAIENYEYTFQPFVTYRRYSREIDKFTTRLSTQKTIFNNECQLLLLAVENHDNIEDVLLDNILKNPEHSARKSDALNRRLEELLGSSLTTCVAKLRLIQETLDEITFETRGFQEVGTKKGKGPFSFFRSKIKISFAKTRLNDIVNELRLYNEDLRTLSKQILDVATQMTPKEQPLSIILSDFNVTRQASAKLHNLLSTKWLCESQVDHTANLSLEVGGAQTCRTASKVRFSLSISCITRKEVTVSEAVWLNIESAPKLSEQSVATTPRPKPTTRVSDGSVSASSGRSLPMTRTSGASSRPGVSPSKKGKEPMVRNANRGESQRSRGSSSTGGETFRLRELKSSAERTSGSSSAHREDTNPRNLTNTLKDLGAARRAVTFDLAPSTHSPRTLPTQTRTAANPSPPTSLATIENLCRYFHSILDQPLLDSVLFSETTRTFQHFVYTCQCPQDCINRTKSLHSILTERADLRRREAWEAKFKLAQLLTLGVLRFRSTPWLENNLKSKDIHFLESKAKGVNQPPSSQAPCLRARLAKRRPDAQKGLSLSRNETLFNLGVILLELGYDAPLQYLRQEEDIQEEAGSMYTDFFTAKRLGLSAVRELDATYGKLVKKCLDCDFGVGDDLDSVELQNAIVVGIVNELDRCIGVDSRVNSMLGP